MTGNGLALKHNNSTINEKEKHKNRTNKEDFNKIDGEKRKNEEEDARQELSNFFSLLSNENWLRKKTINEVKIGVSNFCLYTFFFYFNENNSFVFIGLFHYMMEK